MHLLIRILAVIGFAAVLVRALRTLFRLLQGGAAALVAREVGKTRARRGDVTGLQDALESRAGAVRARRAALGALALLVGMLLLPPLTPWPQLLYACYSVLWLVPHRRPAA